MTAHTEQQNPFSNPAPVCGEPGFDTPYDESKITSFFEHCQNNGWVEDALIALSETQAKNLRQLRENISESPAPHKPLKHGVAVRLEKMASSIERLRDLFETQHPELKSVWFGHLGDGNIHINTLKLDNWSNEKFADKSSDISGLVYGVVKEFEGSISAEHGIGLLKRPTNNEFVSDGETVITKEVKDHLDESRLVNSGKVI